MVSGRAKLWLGGVTLAIIGVTVARGLSRVPDKPALGLAIYAVGVLVALAGLVVIAMGLTRH
ncbi:MAG TPA: hypothetical protein G4O03_05840 [Dehalococcoidia bacterium]|nr:hypothetical protein [Dehalococcoidia bacterium]